MISMSAVFMVLSLLVGQSDVGESGKSAVSGSDGLQEQFYGQTPDTIPMGYIILTFDVDTVIINIPDSYELHTVRSGDTLAVPAGTISKHLMSPFHLDLRSEVEIKADSVHLYHFNYPRPDNQRFNKRSSYFNYFDPHSTLRVTSDPASRIYLNGVYMGRGTMGFILDEGVYRIRTVHPDAGVRRKRIRVSGRHDIGVYSKPLRSRALSLGAIPGASQMYKNQDLKGAIIGTAFFGGLLMAVYQHETFRNEKGRFIRYRDSYNRARTPAALLYYGERTEKSLAKANNHAMYRDLLTVFAAGVYLYNAADAYFSMPSGGYRPENRTVSFTPLISADGAGIGISIQL